MVYTPSSPSSAERIEKLEYTTSEAERERKLLQVKVTHPDISTSSPDLNLHVKKFFYEQLNMQNREIDDQMYVAKMPQPNTVMITLSHHRFKVFLFRAKKELRINSAQVYHDLFINENLTSLNYSLLKKLKSEKKTTQRKQLGKF